MTQPCGSVAFKNLCRPLGDSRVTALSFLRIDLHVCNPAKDMIRKSTSNWIVVNETSGDFTAITSKWRSRKEGAMRCLQRFKQGRPGMRRTVMSFIDNKKIEQIYRRARNTFVSGAGTIRRTNDHIEIP